jgi:GntR family transcriptional regulator
MMILDKKSPIPVYYQLKTILQKKIQNNDYPEGGLIPSEREMSETFKISRMTVRQALNQMVAEGLLIREKGRGTFVAKRKIEQRNNNSFSESVRSKGSVPSTKVLYFKKEKAIEDISGLLDIPPTENIYVLKRLRFADDTPVALEEVFIPEQYCPDLDRYQLDTSLYRIFHEEYGINIAFVDNIIEASVATAEEKKLLHITSSKPVLRVSGITFSSDNKKLSYERDVYRADQFSYKARIFLNREG